MAAINPAVDSENIERVRRAANVDSSAEIAARIEVRINQPWWTNLLEDVSGWEAVRNDHTVIKGDGVDIDANRDRLGFQNRIRKALGLPDLDANGNLKEASGGGILWFGNVTVGREF